MLTYRKKVPLTRMGTISITRPPPRLIDRSSNCRLWGNKHNAYKQIIYMTQNVLKMIKIRFHTELCLFVCIHIPIHLLDISLKLRALYVCRIGQYHTARPSVRYTLRNV